MRAYTLIAMLSVTAGCSGTGDWQGQAPAEPANGDVGKTQQASQFADGTVMNLVDPGATTLTLTADGDAVTVQIFYIGDKTTDTQHIASTAVLVDTLSLASDQTLTHQVDLTNPAFQGGYGALFLNAIGASPTTVFQTYVEYADSIFSVGGSTFEGASYRIPYLSDTRRIVLAFTNQSDFQYDLQIANLGGAGSTTITMAPLTTYRFDSVAEGFDLSNQSSIQIFTEAGGTVAMSGYLTRRHHPNRKIRITPVKAAPFP